MPTAPAVTTARLRLRRAARTAGKLTGLTVAAALCVGTAAAVLTPADAASSKYVSGHDPFGSVSSIKAVSNGLQVTGWAADPDARTSRVSVLGIVDGRTHAGATTSTLPNAAATKKYKLGATPGFSFTIPVPAGNHTACVVVVNTGRGLRKVLKCVATPLGRKLTKKQTAARSPRGSFSTMSANSTSLHVTGWAYDPDYVYRRTVVVLYVDRRAAATVYTMSKSRIDLSVKVGRGTHVGCLWAVNFGWGSNKFLGCRAADTRGAAGSGAVTQPTLNKKVLAEAKKHIGQPYVWGATGPKKFDCSGLVMYSYKKNGYSTPRVSEDQFLAARSIPQSRAVPGDLVFYSDTQGDIYHVGIYSGPNMSVAAIDTQEGVNYQRVYPSNQTFFGSFTHH